MGDGVDFVAPATGTYIIEVCHYVMRCAGEYSIQVEMVP